MQVPRRTELCDPPSHPRAHLPTSPRGAARWRRELGVGARAGEGVAPSKAAGPTSRPPRCEPEEVAGTHLLATGGSRWRDPRRPALAPPLLGLPSPRAPLLPARLGGASPGPVSGSARETHHLAPSAAAGETEPRPPLLRGVSRRGPCGWGAAEPGAPGRAAHLGPPPPPHLEAAQGLCAPALHSRGASGGSALAGPGRASVSGPGSPPCPPLALSAVAAAPAS